MTNTTRWFFRCSDCLSVVAADLDAMPPRTADCGACDGFRTVEVMGRMKRTAIPYLVTGVDERSPCDARCTHARGPSCDCSCNGKNHGSGLLVEIEHTAGIPRLRAVDSVKARAFAEEWRAALAVAMTVVDGRPVYRPEA